MTSKDVNPDDFPDFDPPAGISMLYRCEGGDAHDFVAGPYMAICNRCEKVVTLSHPEGPT